ncbi:MAG: 5'-nucleotidase C-terminal domain-containing protein [Pseudomonadota bacterium]
MAFMQTFLFSKRWVRVPVILLMAIFCSCSLNQDSGGERASPIYHLVVLHTNDTHGHPVKFSYRQARGVGGLPARATLVKGIRKEQKNVLVLDAGDLNTGRPESNLFTAKPDIEGYNTIGYDAMALGNHEFDHPIPVLMRQREWARFPFISANIRKKEGGLLTEPYYIRKFDGFTVAVLGLTTKQTQITGNPDNIRDLVFEDEIRVAKRLVPELRKEADLVIALVHMGLYDSMQKGSKRLASEVSGIDLIVDGHTHTRLESPILVKHSRSDHKTPIVQAWHWGLMVGRVDLWIKNRRVVDFRFKAIPVNLKNVEGIMGEEIVEDGPLAISLQPYVHEVERTLSEAIGYAEGSFPTDHMRNRETALGNMVADSMLWYTKNLGVDFAIQNGGGIRAELPKGLITKGVIHEILPFDNSVVVLTLKGSDLQSLFDYIATLSEGRGAFPQVSEGLSFTINRTKGRCEAVLIKGKPIDPRKIYRVATNSYLAHGGDGYRIFSKALDQYDFALFQRDVFIEYIQFLGGRIRPKIRGRMTILSDKDVSLVFKRAA